jgi:fructose-1-phosphate kinase PfkB-like protein
VVARSHHTLRFLSLPMTDQELERLAEQAANSLEADALAAGKTRAEIDRALYEELLDACNKMRVRLGLAPKP